MGKTVHWEDFTLRRLYWKRSTQRKLHTGRKALVIHDWKDCTLGRLYTGKAVLEGHLGRLY